MRKPKPKKLFTRLRHALPALNGNNWLLTGAFAFIDLFFSGLLA
jgi:hypothetical protein